MNQRQLLLSTLLVAGASFAQSGRPTRYALQHDDSHGAAPAVAQPRGGGEGVVVFEEDFANGLAGNNGVGAWTTSGPDGALWLHDTDGPNGDFSSTTQRIVSTTVANGFMIFDSNLSNDACEGDGCIERDGALESPVLDLTANPAVMLQFSQRLRWCCQQTAPNVLQISLDAGATWNTTISTTTGITTNNDPGTQTKEISLTGIIASNPASVKFRFQHNPTASHYHWQIDDVKLITVPQNDVLMLDAYMSHTGDGEEYARIPAGQLNPTMLVGGNVINNGAVEQTGVTVTMAATGPVPFTSTIVGGSIAPGDTLAIDEAFTLPSLTTGVYEATFTASADATDENTTNNETGRWFEVNEELYALDGLENPPAADASLAVIGTSSFEDIADGMMVMTYYPVREPLMVYGIEIGLVGPNTPGNFFETVPGGTLTAAMLDTTDVFASPQDVYNPIVISSLVDITQGDVDAGFKQIPLLNDDGEQGVEMPVGGYFAAVDLYSNGGENHIRLLDDIGVPQPAAATLFWSPADEQTFGNGNAVAIRLLLTPLNIGIGEQQAHLDGVSMYPNPTTGAFTLSVKEAGNYMVEVTNVLGEVVLSTNTSAQRTDLDLTGHAKGVYMVRVSNATASTVQRVTLK